MFEEFSKLEILPAGGVTAGPLSSFCSSPGVRDSIEVAIVAKS